MDQENNPEADPKAPAPNEERWNYHALFAQGIFFNAARSLASPQLVLPFLYMALGAPTFLAGLITPLVQFSQLVSQIIAAPFIKSSQTRKWYIVLCNAGLACFLGIVALASRDGASAILVVSVFLLVALAIGAIQGINSIAYGDLIGSTLRSETRNQLLFLVAAIAGAAAIAAAWLSPKISGSASPLQQHVTLLWLGVGITALAALPTVLLRENLQGAKQTTGRSGFLTSLREGLSHTAGVKWFRQYMVARMMLISVTLAMPFYTVHGADLHATKSGSLSAFVVASSLGAIVAGPMWALLARKSHRLVFAASAMLGAVAGGWAIAVDTVPALQSVSLHAVVFTLVSAAALGVSGSQTLYIVQVAPPENRTYFIAVANGLSGVLGVIVAFVFGAIAHLQGTIWPVMIIASLNLLAVWACIRLRET